MFAVKRGQMSAAETGRMFAVETSLTRQMSKSQISSRSACATKKMHFQKMMKMKTLHKTLQKKHFFACVDGVFEIVLSTPQSVAPRLRPGCSCETASSCRLLASCGRPATIACGGSCAAAWLGLGDRLQAAALENMLQPSLPKATAAPRCCGRGLWRWQSFCVGRPKIESFSTRETKFATFNAWRTTGGRRWWADCLSGLDCRRLAASGWRPSA